jgi:Rrf2 family protein
MMSNTHFAVAVHALTYIAFARDEAVSSAEMAASINTNPVFLQRILRALSANGLIEIQRGVNGGSVLRHLPEDITLYDVYRAVQDDESSLKIHEMPNIKCEVGSNIHTVLLGVITQVDAALKTTLSHITIADMVQGIKEEIGH